MHQIAGWWDGFELWVAGLPFIPQFIVVLVGMVPVSFAIAYLLDRLLRISLQVLGRNRPSSTVPTAEAVVAAAPALMPEPIVVRETAQSGAR